MAALISIFLTSNTIIASEKTKQNNQHDQESKTIPHAAKKSQSPTNIPSIKSDVTNDKQADVIPCWAPLNTCSRAAMISFNPSTRYQYTYHETASLHSHLLATLATAPPAGSSSDSAN